jgi:hypothetical protein
MSHPEEAPPPRIRAIPRRYRGTLFRSTLEADWAATFDRLGWDGWEYEPVGIELPDGTLYRPDFRLRAQRVWCEVKGPHNERMNKVVGLQEALGNDEWEWGADLVVVLRAPGPGETAQWHGIYDHQRIAIVLCPECQHYSFMDYNGLWSCRYHLSIQREKSKFWTGAGGDFYWSGDLPFARLAA